MAKQGLLIVLSAPSGCGKSTLVRRLLELHPKLRFSVSATTRAPREGETDGVDYYFIEKDQFQRMIKNDEFLEYAQYVDNSYGTPRAPVERETGAGNDVLLDIETNGAFQVMERWPGAVTVFLLPPSFEELERRLTTRGKDSPDVIARRLEEAKRECSLADRYAYNIVNDDVARAAGEFIALIDKEREKRR